MKTLYLNPDDVCCDICIRKATKRIVLSGRSGYSCQLHISEVSRIVRETVTYMKLWRKHSEVV